MEVDCRGTGTNVFQVLPELAKVPYAASGPDLFAGCERLEGDAACLLQFPGCEVCVGEHHRGEEIAAHEHVIVDGLDAAARILRGVGGTAEVAQAVTELGGKLSFVEVPDPLRIGLFGLRRSNSLAASARAWSHAFASPSRARARASMAWK